MRMNRRGFRRDLGMVSALLLTLSSISLFSLGFSSFALNDNPPVYGTVSAEFAPVLEIISVDSSHDGGWVEPFTFCRDGFVIDGKLHDTASHVFHLLLDASKAYSSGLLEDGSLRIGVDLTEGGSSPIFVKEGILGGLSVGYSNRALTANPVFNDIGASFEASLPLAGDEGTIPLSMSFAFNVPADSIDAVFTAAAAVESLKMNLSVEVLG